MPQSFASVARRYYKTQMSSLKSVRVPKDIGGRSINVGFTSYGNKHLYSDTFRRSRTFQRADLLNLPELLGASTYVRSSGLSKTRKDKITGFHYFKVKLHGDYVYLNVAEEVKGGKMKRYVYSVTDRIK